jgi:hypothetical protein
VNDERLDDHVRKLVETFPPLTAEEKEWLAPLWRPAVVAMHRRRAEAERRAGLSRRTNAASEKKPAKAIDIPAGGNGEGCQDL